MHSWMGDRFTHILKSSLAVLHQTKYMYNVWPSSLSHGCIRYPHTSPGSGMYNYFHWGINGGRRQNSIKQKKQLLIYIENFLAFPDPPNNLF